MSGSNLTLPGDETEDACRERLAFSLEQQAAAFAAASHLYPPFKNAVVKDLYARAAALRSGGKK